jgi:transposase
VQQGTAPAQLNECTGNSFPTDVIQVGGNLSVDRRLRETGSFKLQRAGQGARTVRTPEFEEIVLDRFTEDPSVSTRTVASEMHVSKDSVWRVLKELQLHTSPTTSASNGA